MAALFALVHFVATHEGPCFPAIVSPDDQADPSADAVTLHVFGVGGLPLTVVNGAAHRDPHAAPDKPGQTYGSVWHTQEEHEAPDGGPDGPVEGPISPLVPVGTPPTS